MHKPLWSLHRLVEHTGAVPPSVSSSLSLRAAPDGQKAAEGGRSVTGFRLPFWSSRLHVIHARSLFAVSLSLSGELNSCGQAEHAHQKEEGNHMFSVLRTTVKKYLRVALCWKARYSHVSCEEVLQDQDLIQGHMGF